MSDLLDCRFGAGQVFDVQYNYSGTLGVDRMLNVSGAKRPYQSANPPAGALGEDDIADGDYFAFVDSVSDPGTYALQQFDSGNALVRTLHDTGSFRATGPGIVHYLGNGFYGTVFTTQSTLELGGSGSFDITAENPTDVEVLSFTDCLATPLPTGSAPASWTDETLGALVAGVAFSDGVAADGSPAPTYAVTAGALPAGLVLDANTGAITGTPTGAGDFSFTITATNGSGSIERAFSGSVAAAPTAPAAWSDETLGALRVGTASTDGVAADGNPAPTYSVTAGALPAGLVLDAATGAITGTPTTAGAFSVTITATNSEGSISTTITGTVAAAPTAAVELELGFGTGTDLSTGDTVTTVRGEKLKPGSTYTLTLFSTPRVLATGTVDANGAFSQQVTVPADIASGSHRLVIGGVDDNDAAVERSGWFWVDEFGVVGNVSTAGPVSAPPMLARSGAPLDVLVSAGATLLALGVAAIGARRRFATATR
ncbi:MAG: Ig domain-containing protein [Actinomycetota bacterium]|nr:Ig domain-containing protein [Actinomycetota bacterium]